MTINLEVHWGYRVLTHIHIIPRIMEHMVVVSRGLSLSTLKKHIQLFFFTKGWLLRAATIRGMILQAWFTKGVGSWWHPKWWRPLSLTELLEENLVNPSRYVRMIHSERFENTSDGTENVSLQMMAFECFVKILKWPAHMFGNCNA